MKRIVLIAFLALAVQSLNAQTAYVTDKLRLGVHLTRDTSGQPFDYLYSGDAVKVLERDGQLTFVELEDQRTGWVRGSFLQAEEPALRRVTQVETENARLTSEIEALRANDSGQEIERLKAAERDALERASAAEAERSAVESEVRSLREQLAALRGGVPLWWLVAGVLAALLLGWLLAWRWLDYRSRQRHGGFRIY